MSNDRLNGLIDDVLGTHDHNMSRDRPYTGQPHTVKGVRGATEIRGITFRDLRDCYIRAVLSSTGGASFPDPSKRAMMETLYHEAQKGEGAVLSEGDLYGFNFDLLDPVAVCQNLCCEIEMLLGIFPNIDGREVAPDPEMARLRSIISEVHGWIVCAAIATPEDMMQNAEHICNITSPDYKGSGAIE